MAAPTIYRLAEEILKIVSGGDIQASTNVSINEIKVSIGQVLNQILKTEYFSVNTKSGEAIPNGYCLATYTGIDVTQYGNGKSKATLPIKPMRLPRNMGVYSVYPSGNPDKEFIPLQLGQTSLLQSQPLLNTLLGQVGYEVKGDTIYFTKNLLQGQSSYTIDMQLAIMDVSQYGDYDPLPILPEHEWQIKQEVVKLYSQVGIADMLADATTKQQQNIPLKDQQQTG